MSSLYGHWALLSIFRGLFTKIAQFCSHSWRSIAALQNRWLQGTVTASHFPTGFPDKHTHTYISAVQLPSSCIIYPATWNRQYTVYGGIQKSETAMKIWAFFHLKLEMKFLEKKKINSGLRFCTIYVYILVLWGESNSEMNVFYLWNSIYEINLISDSDYANFI